MDLSSGKLYGRSRESPFNYPVREVLIRFSDIFKQHDSHLDALACGALLVQYVFHLR